MEYKPCVIDIETNGLLADMLDFSSLPYKLRSDAQLWCVVIRNALTGEVKKADREGVTKEWLEAALSEFTYIVAHNGVKFDWIVLKLFGVFDYRIGYPGESDTLFGREALFIDSLILSRLFNPDRYAGHSLDSWGERVGEHKTNYRQACIDAGYIQKDAPKGFEFTIWTPLLLDYCEQDTKVNALAFEMLLEEWNSYDKWNRAIRMEHKLADLAIRRESFGFWFDKDLALECLKDLTQKMEELQNRVNPLLPPKPMTQTELKEYTLPSTQLKKDGKPGNHLLNWVERTEGALLIENQEDWMLSYEGEIYTLPHHEPLKTELPADISNLDHVKSVLIEKGWDPSEFRERDLTKGSKKQSLTYDKRIKALTRWYNETLEGKYQKHRLELVEVPQEQLFEHLSEKLKQDWPVRVPTSPCVRVGVEKELCPNLIKLGEKVSFAADFALYLTYKHRKSSIAGGEIEDMDFDLESPNTGYLSAYREEDGRVPTPAIEIGTATSRYVHRNIANIPRSTSVYGKELRSLFCAGPDYIQLGFDFSSLENRVQAGYVKKYTGGEELGIALVAEKPNDLHSLNAKKFGISRSDSKSVGYASLYGASGKKLARMLGVPLQQGEKMHSDFWSSVPALKELRDNVLKFWDDTGKVFIPAIDGRKLRVRSPHSILNMLFQSAGVIAAKYTTVFLFERLEELGFKTNPFEDEPDFINMIDYHDELNNAVKAKFFKFKVFGTEEDAQSFVAAWEGPQLSAISHKKKWFVCLPNDITESITYATKKTEVELNLQFELGFEYILGRNWYDCH